MTVPNILQIEANIKKKAKDVYETLISKNTKKIYLAKAELIGRFKKKRRPLPSISLTGNNSTLICIANDFGYENIFSRQIEALGKKGDVLFAISTSGNSKNIFKALKKAKNKSLKTISFLGNSDGNCKNIADLDIIIKSNSTARIQEMHIFIGQIICEIIEKKIT